jgi:hypothetical protein
MTWPPARTRALYFRCIRDLSRDASGAHLIDRCVSVRSLFFRSCRPCETLTEGRYSDQDVRGMPSRATDQAATAAKIPASSGEVGEGRGWQKKKEKEKERRALRAVLRPAARVPERADAVPIYTLLQYGFQKAQLRIMGRTSARTRICHVREASAAQT